MSFELSSPDFEVVDLFMCICNLNFFNKICSLSYLFLLNNIAPNYHSLDMSEKKSNFKFLTHRKVEKREKEKKMIIVVKHV